MLAMLEEAKKAQGFQPEENDKEPESPSKLSA